MGLFCAWGPVMHRKHAASAMMPGIITNDSRKEDASSLHTIWSETQWQQVPALHLPCTAVLPRLNENYPAGDCCCQQDSAPGHHSLFKSAELGQGQLPKFWEQGSWWLSSPDFNPFDFFLGLSGGEVEWSAAPQECGQLQSHD